MKKTLKTIKNIFVGIFLVAYFTVIILVSSLLLSRNDYGVTQFGDKVFIKITKEIANDKYKEGSLVILEAKEIFSKPTASLTSSFNSINLFLSLISSRE